MNIRFQTPRIIRPPWIPNDPVSAVGTEGLEAYYASVLAHPLVLEQTRCFFHSGSGKGTSSTPALHIVPLIGQRLENWEPPILNPGDRVFLDGLVPAGAPPLLDSLPGHTPLTSLKERVTTASGEFFIPENLTIAMWDEIPGNWESAGDREGMPFYLFNRTTLLSPVQTGYVDFLLRRDNGRIAWNWRFFLAETLSRWLGGKQAASQSKEARALWDLFCAYGFHRWFVEKTALHLDETANFLHSDTQVFLALDALSKGHCKEAEAGISGAFGAIRGELDRLTGTSHRVFAEAHHGGMLHEDIGFFEHDWPQQVCDQIREYLSHEGSIVSLDMPANLFRYYKQRFPHYFQQLLQWQAQGRLEILNGMWGQPYSDSHSLENLLGQFIAGIEELDELFDSGPYIFASEEYCLGPAMPQILQAAGIDRAVHAVRLGGVSKTNSPAVRQWTGLNGECIKAIEHPDIMPSGVSTRYFLNLPKAFATAREKNRDIIALFNIPDFGWNILFRDEIFTALKYAPLFKMVTFGELFRILPAKREAVRQDWEDTYHTIFNQYVIRGDMRAYFEYLRKVEYLLVASETQSTASNLPLPWLKSAWHDYLLGSSHDYTLVGGGINGWYGASTKATYKGPLQISFSRTLEGIMHEKLKGWERRLASTLHHDETGAYLTNLHGFPVQSRICFDGEFYEANLAPFSSRLLTDCPRSAGGVTRTANSLDNGRLRVVIDPETGAMESITFNGRERWKGNRWGLALPGKTLTYAEGRLSPDPVHPGGILHRARITSDHTLIGWIETACRLAPDTDDLLVEVQLCPAAMSERGNFDWPIEWNRTFRYAIPNPSPSTEVLVFQAGMQVRAQPARRDAGNLAEMIPDTEAHVLSPEVLGLPGVNGDPLWIHNAGFPVYLVYRDRVEQFLQMPGEHKLSLSFGIGFGNGRHTPVQRSRMLFCAPGRANQPLSPLPIAWNNPRIGLIRAIPQDAPSASRLWLYNFSDREETATFELNNAWEAEAHPSIQPGEPAVLPPYSLAALDLTLKREAPASLMAQPGMP